MQREIKNMPFQWAKKHQMETTEECKKGAWSNKIQSIAFLMLIDNEPESESGSWFKMLPQTSYRHVLWCQQYCKNQIAYLNIVANQVYSYFSTVYSHLVEPLRHDNTPWNLTLVVSWNGSRRDLLLWLHWPAQPPRCQPTPASLG